MCGAQSPGPIARERHVYGGRRIPEGCMVLAGGRWPPECRPPQIRVPEGRTDMAWCHAGWTWRAPGRCAAAFMRPCRDAGTNGHPDPGATGPRLISKGPPGPRRCPSRRMRRVAANQRSAAGPTPYLGPTCGEGPTCGRRPTHPGGMHGISRGPVAPGMPAPTNTRPGGTHGHGVVPRGLDVARPRPMRGGLHASLPGRGHEWSP